MPFLLLTFIIALAVSLQPQSFKFPDVSTTEPETVSTTFLGPEVVKTWHGFGKVEDVPSPKSQ